MFMVSFIYYLFLSILSICLIILFFYFIIKHFGSKLNENLDDSDIDKVSYIPKKFLSNCEYDFFRKFISLEDEINVHIVPQVNLASIIEKKSESRFNTELFRNIDFGIFNADYSKILLLIELNDDSHNNYYRKKRDIKVKDICSKAGIKLITFYTKYPNESNYVKDRIISELKQDSNNN